MTAPPPPAHWLTQAVFYEIYPQSFADSDGDGIGDFPGVLAHLDHLAWLGVNTVWFNPCFVSPFRDAGYDVADYLRVAPRYGSNDDLIGLVDAARERGIRVLLDLVAGHTSSTTRGSGPAPPTRPTTATSGRTGPARFVPLPFPPGLLPQELLRLATRAQLRLRAARPGGAVAAAGGRARAAPTGPPRGMALRGSWRRLAGLRRRWVPPGTWRRCAGQGAGGFEATIATPARASGPADLHELISRRGTELRTARRCPTTGRIAPTARRGPASCGAGTRCAWIDRDRCCGDGRAPAAHRDADRRAARRAAARHWACGGPDRPHASVPGPFTGPLHLALRAVLHVPRPAPVPSLPQRGGRMRSTRASTRRRRTPMRPGRRRVSAGAAAGRLLIARPPDRLTCRPAGRGIGPTVAAGWSRRRRATGAGPAADDRWRPSPATPPAAPSPSADHQLAGAAAPPTVGGARASWRASRPASRGLRGRRRRSRRRRAYGRASSAPSSREHGVRSRAAPQRLARRAEHGSTDAPDGRTTTVVITSQISAATP